MLFSEPATSWCLVRSVLQVPGSLLAELAYTYGAFGQLVLGLCFSSQPGSVWIGQAGTLRTPVPPENQTDATMAELEASADRACRSLAITSTAAALIFVMLPNMGARGKLLRSSAVLSRKVAFSPFSI